MGMRMRAVHHKSVRLISEFDGVERTGISYVRDVACACSSVVYTITSTEVCARLQPLACAAGAAGGGSQETMVRTEELVHLVGLVRAVRALLEVSEGDVGQWRCVDVSRVCLCVGVLFEVSDGGLYIFVCVWAVGIV
jgi:hypothetical protein